MSWCFNGKSEKCTTVFSFSNSAFFKTLCDQNINSVFFSFTAFMLDTQKWISQSKENIIQSAFLNILNNCWLSVQTLSPPQRPVCESWGERKRECAGHDGKGKARRAREARFFPSSHRPPRAFYFFRLLLLSIGIPSGNLCRGERCRQIIVNQKW